MFIRKTLIITCIIFVWSYAHQDLNAQYNHDASGYSHAIYVIPTENEMVYYKAVTLVWEKISESGKYHLQLSNTKDFSGLILDTIICHTSMTTPHLKNHTEYFWRVRDLGPGCEVYDFVDFNFFKTTSIVMEETKEDNIVNIYPTHIKGLEVLYFDNPESVNFEIKISDASSKDHYVQRCKADRKGITTASWPRGSYEVTITTHNHEPQVRKFVLY
ncbi:MAG: hypothetical protein H7X99_01930 [Saprospiraceae bacterium]|nr:hypothetical protein [Saprospiraceae bacterium]